jgi:hypothetical protein
LADRHGPVAGLRLLRRPLQAYRSSRLVPKLQFPHRRRPPSHYGAHFPTCCPRRRLPALMAFSSGSRRPSGGRSGSAASGATLIGAHSMWFTFVMACRFSSPTADPSPPRGGTGVGLSVVNHSIRPAELSSACALVALAAARPASRAGLVA